MLLKCWIFRHIEESGLLEVGIIRLGFSAVEIDRPFSSRPDRELVAFERAVTELDGPHDGISTSQRNNITAQGNEVVKSSHLDCLLRTNLDAVVAFPALVRFLVPCKHSVDFELHQVDGTDIHNKLSFPGPCSRHIFL